MPAGLSNSGRFVSAPVEGCPEGVQAVSIFGEVKRPAQICCSDVTVCFFCSRVPSDYVDSRTAVCGEETLTLWRHHARLRHSLPCLRCYLPGGGLPCANGARVLGQRATGFRAEQARPARCELGSKDRVRDSTGWRIADRAPHARHRCNRYVPTPAIGPSHRV